MKFDSNIFVMLLLPIIILCGFLTRKKIRIQNFIILLFNICFLLWNGYLGAIVLGYSCIVLYIFSRKLFRINAGRNGSSVKKVLVILCVVMILAPLVYFKYFSRMIPLGISFYTFEAISFLCDINDGKIQESPKMINIVFYLSFFATITSGPIVRYGNISGDITERNITTEQYNIYIYRFIIGYAKKSLIADKLSPLSDYYFNNVGVQGMHLSTVGLWIGSIAYSLVLYFDFSGYTDMAIALAGMLGFHLPENFDKPYLSVSIADFWRRWHISLSKWFRDYVYIPLGGNRVSHARNILNICIVWVLTGIWHGFSTTYAIWAMGHCALILNEKYNPYMKKALKNGIFSHVYTLFAVNLLWIFFNSKSLFSALLFVKGMFVYSGTMLEPVAGKYMIYLVLALVCCLPWQGISKKFFTRQHHCTAQLILKNVFICMIFILSVSAKINCSYSPFIYSKF